MSHYLTKVGIGQDSHRFLHESIKKEFVLGGLSFQDCPGADADSDGDVVLHSLCNAITSITGVPILGKIAIELCHKEGITDSKVYLKHALASLHFFSIQHVAFAIEGKRPRLEDKIFSLRKNIALLLNIQIDQVGMTCTSGNELTSFSKGEGIQCFCILTVFSINV